MAVIYTQFAPRSPPPNTSWIFRNLPAAPQAGQLFTQTVDDQLDLLDEFIKNLAANKDETQDAFDSFVKTHSLGQGETAEIQDAFVKLLGANREEDIILEDTLNKTLGKTTGDDQVLFSDTSLTDRVLALLASDQIDLTDEIVKTLAKILDEQQETADDHTKLLLKILSDDLVEIADSVAASKFAPITIDDELIISDAFVKHLAMNALEQNDIEDAVLKALNKVLSDDQIDFTDTASAVRIFAAVLEDQLDLTDAIEKLYGKSADEIIDIFDDYLKTHNIGAGDEAIIEDALTKLRGSSIDDDIAFDDSASAVRLLVQDLNDQLILSDDLLKTIGLNMGEAVEVSDAFEKLLLKVFDESCLLDDSSPTRLFITALQDILIISESDSKLIQKTLDEAPDIIDGLEKLLAKLLDDSLPLTDEATATYLPGGVAVIAQYLEVMLTDSRDLVGRSASGGAFMRRLGAIKDLTKRDAGGSTFLNRLGKIKDLAGRIAKDKGTRK